MHYEKLPQDNGEMNGTINEEYREYIGRLLLMIINDWLLKRIVYSFAAAYPKQENEYQFPTNGIKRGKEGTCGFVRGSVLP